jgi:flagellar hook-associated protein 1 FlgK
LTTPDNGLEMFPSNGSFYIAVKNETNDEVRAVQVEVDLDGIDPTNDTSLDDLVVNINAALNAAYGGASPVTATVTADNRLQMTAAPTFSFTFGQDGAQSREDTSGVLAALGVNTFFDGNKASDITVNATLASNPNLLAASQVGDPGDGGNAGCVADLATAANGLLNGMSLLEYYNSVVSNVAVKTSSAKNAVESADVIVLSLRSQREAISGVSLDEEALNLLTFQRAFQGAARIVATVDEMLQEILNMVR